MKYPQRFDQYFANPDVAGIAAEILHLIYSTREPGEFKGFDAVWLYDRVQEHPEVYPNLSKLTQQQFLWRTAMCLRTLGYWQKQSKNSHYWWRRDPAPRRRMAPWFTEWLESAPIPRQGTIPREDRSLQKKISDFFAYLR